VEWFFPFYWAAAVDPVACGLVFGPPCQFRLGRLVVAATTTGAALSGIGSASGADGGLSAGGVAPVSHPGCPRCPWRWENQGISRAQHGSDEQTVVRTASRRRRCPHVA
jgi:hypothetical protein